MHDVIPREELRNKSDLAFARDRTDAYLAGLRRELAPPEVSRPQQRVLDRSTAHEDPERWDGLS